MRERYFTLEEATALLPRLTELLTALRERQRALQARGQTEQARARTNGHVGDQEARARRQAEIEAEVAALQAGVAEIAELGVEVKDIEMGLVDFRARREGRVVYLCWRLGEPAIEWWHELDTGFAGRQPL